jgi:uncharacterized membrane protein (UPF0127 family)
MQMRRVIGATIVAALVACRADHGPVARIHGGSGPVDVVVEIVDTPAAREQGLMYRKFLADGTGMLFVFDEEVEHPFWMKNTLIPLDMIFIDTKQTIVGIATETRPLSLQSVTVGRPSRYVLEVPGGWTAKHGVRTGDRVELPAAARRRA